MKLIIKKGSIDQTITVFIPNSSSTTGAGLTGLTYNSSGLSCYYVRPGSAAAQLSLVTQTTTGAHSDGGFVEIDATNLPGFYRLDLSDAIVAAGVNSAAIMLKGATNMAPTNVELQLDDNTSADNYGVLTNANYGLDKLVRSTTPANALSVDSSNRALSDMAAISGDSGAADNLEAACDGTGYNVGGGSVVAASVTGNVGGNISGTVPNSAGVTTLLGLVTEARMGALTDWINGGRLDLILDTIAGDVVNLDGAAMRGTDNAALASAWTATRAGYIDLINTYLDAAITSRLATAGYTAPDNTNIGNIIAALEHATHGLSALLTAINTRLAASGYTAPDNAGITMLLSRVTAAVALASDLSTVAGYLDTEIAAILEDTGTTLPGLIAALNNLSSDQAQIAAAAALTAYDPPTKAEMDAGHALLATAASIASLNNISTADVLAQAAAALEATVTEPADLTNKSVKGLLYHLYARFFHRNTQTATTQTTYKADGTTPLAERDASDDGTTQELGEAE